MKRKSAIIILAFFICIITNVASRTIYGTSEACNSLYSYVPRNVTGFTGASINKYLECFDLAIIIYIKGDPVDNNSLVSIFSKTSDELNSLIIEKEFMFWIDSTKSNPALLILSKDIQTFQDNLFSNSGLKSDLNFIWYYINWSDSTNTTWTSSGYPSKVFKGLFKNPDYKNTNQFLIQDPQTKFTYQVQVISNIITDGTDNIETVKKIFNLLEACAPMITEGRTVVFERTSSEILTSRVSGGCTDRAIAFVALAREKGIPSVLVDAAKISWILDGAKLLSVEGHFFAEIKLGNIWYLVDPSGGFLYHSYNNSNYYLPGNYIAFCKSLSVIDAGVTEENHNLLQRVAFWGNSIDKYIKPKYIATDLKDEYLVETYTQKIDNLNLIKDMNPVKYKTSLQRYTIKAPVKKNTFRINKKSF